MTLRDFSQLSDEVQLAYFYRLGTYLARRWDDFHRAALLYQDAQAVLCRVGL